MVQLSTEDELGNRSPSQCLRRYRSTHSSTPVPITSVVNQSVPTEGLYTRLNVLLTGARKSQVHADHNRARLRLAARSRRSMNRLIRSWAPSILRGLQSGASCQCH